MSEPSEGSPANRADVPFEDRELSRRTTRRKSYDKNYHCLTEVKRGLSVYEEETKKIAPPPADEDPEDIIGRSGAASPEPDDGCSDFHMSSVSANASDHQHVEDVRNLRQKVEALEHLVMRRISIEAKLDEAPEQPSPSAPSSPQSRQIITPSPSSSPLTRQVSELSTAVLIASPSPSRQVSFFSELPRQVSEVGQIPAAEESLADLNPVNSSSGLSPSRFQVLQVNPPQAPPESPPRSPSNKGADRDPGAEGEDTDGVPDEIPMTSQTSDDIPEPHSQHRESSPSTATAEAPVTVGASPSAASSVTDEGRTQGSLTPPESNRLADSEPFARILSQPELPSAAASPSWQAMGSARIAMEQESAQIQCRSREDLQPPAPRPAAPAIAPRPTAAQPRTLSPEQVHRSSLLGQQTRTWDEARACWVTHPHRAVPSSSSTSVPARDSARMESAPRAEVLTQADVITDNRCCSARKFIQENAMVKHTFTEAEEDQAMTNASRRTPRRSPVSTTTSPSAEKPGGSPFQPDKSWITPRSPTPNWRAAPFRANSSLVPSSTSPSQGQPPVHVIYSPKMATRVTVGTIDPRSGASRPVARPPGTTLRSPATMLRSTPPVTGQGNCEGRSCTVPMATATFAELRERGLSSDPSSRELQRSTSASLPASFIQGTPPLGHRTASPIGGRRSTVGAIVRTASPIGARSTVGTVVSSTRDDTNMFLAHGGDWEQAKRKLEQDYNILRARGADWENAKRKLEQERSKIQATVRRLEAALEQANEKPGGTTPVEASIACVSAAADGNNSFLVTRGNVRRRSPPRGGLRRSTLDQGAPQQCSPRLPQRSESVDVGNSTRIRVPVVRTLSPLQSGRMPRAMPEAGSAIIAVAGAWTPLEAPLFGGGAGSALVPGRSWDSPTVGSAQVPAGPSLAAGPPPVPGQSPGLTLRSTTPIMQTRSPLAIGRSPREPLRSPLRSPESLFATIPNPAEAKPLTWKPSRSVEAPHGGTRDLTPPPSRFVTPATCAREELVVHSARAYQVGKQNLESVVYVDSSVTSRMGMVSLTSSSASSARTAL